MKKLSLKQILKEQEEEIKPGIVLLPAPTKEELNWLASLHPSQESRRISPLITTGRTVQKRNRRLVQVMWLWRGYESMDNPEIAIGQKYFPEKGTIASFGKDPFVIADILKSGNYQIINPSDLEKHSDPNLVDVTEQPKIRD